MYIQKIIPLFGNTQWLNGRTNEAYYKCDVTSAGARREILNRRDRRRIKKGCVTLFESFPTILTYFSSCTARAGLDDAPAMSLQCFVSA